jgi:hypothetical protein
MCLLWSMNWVFISQKTTFFRRSIVSVLKCVVPVCNYLIHEGLPGQMSHWLKFVVDEQLRQHEQKSEGIHTIHQTVNAPRVPTARRNNWQIMQQAKHGGNECMHTWACPTWHEHAHMHSLSLQCSQSHLHQPLFSSGSQTPNVGGPPSFVFPLQPLCKSYSKSQLHSPSSAALTDSTPWSNCRLSTLDWTELKSKSRWSSLVQLQ